MVVELDGVTKFKGRRIILQKVDLAVPPNTVCGVFGANGAGKTSLIRTVTGAWRPSDGRLSLFGQPWNERLLRQVGVVWDTGVFHESWSALEVLRVYSNFYHGSAEKGATMFSRLGLQGNESVPIRKYSLGMRKRLSLGLALLKEPQLLILDEPSDGLDAPAARVLWDTLGRFAQGGKSVIVTSHHLDQVTPVCSMALALSHGRSVGVWSRHESAVELSRWVSERLEDASGGLSI